MREIKFRAFDKEIEGGHMVYSDGRDKADRQVEYDFQIDEKGNLVCGWFEDYDDSCGFSKTNSGTLDNLMQFTGLRDKNGKEIFERDIWKSCENGIEETGVVEYYGCSFRVNYGDTYDLLGLAVRYGEVVGNIHENPGLLEQQPCG